MNVIIIILCTYRYPIALRNILQQVTGLRELCKNKLDSSDKVRIYSWAWMDQYYSVASNVLVIVHRWLPSLSYTMICTWKTLLLISYYRVWIYVYILIVHLFRLVVWITNVSNWLTDRLQLYHSIMTHQMRTLSVVPNPMFVYLYVIPEVRTSRYS